MGNYIIYMVLLAILLFNLYAMFSSQRRKKRSAEEMKRQQSELAKRAIEAGKKAGIKFDAQETYMNDKGRVILATIDKDKRVLGIFYGEDEQIIPYDDILNVEVVTQADEKHVYSINVEITCREKTLSYPFSTERRKRKGWIASFIQKDASEFVTALKSLK